MLTDDEESHTEFLLVNPHKNKELLYEVGFEKEFNKLGIKGFIQEQYILNNNVEDRTFLYAGISAVVGKQVLNCECRFKSLKFSDISCLF